MATETLGKDDVDTSPAVNIFLWIVQIIGAVMFFIAGMSKLTGDAAMIRIFDTIGLGQWFRYFTGMVEVLAAVCLLTPRYSGLGALLLVPTMIGAIITHFFVIGGSPMVPIILVTMMAIVAIGRKEHVLQLLRR